MNTVDTYYFLPLWHLMRNLHHVYGPTFAKTLNFVLLFIFKAESNKIVFLKKRPSYNSLNFTA